MPECCFRYKTPLAGIDCNKFHCVIYNSIQAPLFVELEYSALDSLHFAMRKFRWGFPPPLLFPQKKNFTQQFKISEKLRLMIYCPTQSPELLIIPLSSCFCSNNTYELLAPPPRGFIMPSTPTGDPVRLKLLLQLITRQPLQTRLSTVNHASLQ
jgi:hypothetical protein